MFTNHYMPRVCDLLRENPTLSPWDRKGGRDQPSLGTREQQTVRLK